MSRKCFPVQGIDPGSEFVELSAEASHHLDKVLRLRTGEKVELRDGRGNAWAGEIAQIAKSTVLVRVLGRLDYSSYEPPFEIVLALALVRSDVLDLGIRQATELGVTGLALFRAARSQYALYGPGAEKKLRRWEKVADEAVCQCGRTCRPWIALFEDLGAFLEESSSAGLSANSLRNQRTDLRQLRNAAASVGSVAKSPSIHHKDSDEMLKNPVSVDPPLTSDGSRTSTCCPHLVQDTPLGKASEVLRVFALEGEREKNLETLRNSFPRCAGVVAAIGPEGGWEAPEIEKLVSAGFHPVHLGPRILRFETAAVALISAVQLLWGDYGSGTPA